jgi:hypothetical protein
LPSTLPALAPAAVGWPFWEANPGEEVGADVWGACEEDPAGGRSPP